MPTETRPWRKMLNTDWTLRLTALLIAVVLLQYVNWIIQEEVIWRLETVLLVKWVLFLVGMTYLIPRIHWAMRSFIQLALIIMVQMRLFELHFSAIHLRPLSAFKQSIAANFIPFEPYIWFGLSAWLCYVAMMWFVQSKMRIYLMILMSVLFFAVRDSFSSIVLWQQVAIILFCGLSLLIIRHFAELKNRAPKSWEKLIEYPASLVVPITLLIAATVLIGALAPSINPLITDPYTAWKVSRGEPFTLSGKGLPVSIPAKDGASGYSRDDRQLGGGFKFDYSAVMTVTMDTRTYMRGETRSFYNGTGWEQSDTEKKLPLSGVSGADLPQDPRFNTSLLKTKENKQSVVMDVDNNQTYPILFGGYAIKRLEEVNKGESGFDSLKWSPRQSELRYTAKNKYPNEYTVISEEPEYKEDELRQTAANFAGKQEWNEYLQLPKDLPARVKQLAANLTQDDGNPYDKVKKIEKYLSQNFPYTNEPNLSKGSSKDFVDRFLFEIKEGYCDYYSSAMVVMTRSIGLPARWVKGYSSGQSPIPPDLESLGIMSSQLNVNSNGSGVYTIRNSDAHSWVEVYFDGWGWIPFEPTAGFTMPTVVTPETTTPDTTLPDVAAGVDTPVTMTQSGFALPQWMAVIVSTLVLVLISLFLLHRFGLLAEWKDTMNKKQGANFNQKIIVEFERLLRYGKRKGYRRQEHETMREALDRWGKQSRWIKTELDTVLQLFERAKYSQMAASEQDFLSVNQAIQRLRTQMK
jgi:transglutaminase-like putative cysteine protease